MSDDSSILELIDPANELRQLDRYEATKSFRTLFGRPGRSSNRRSRTYTTGT
jgi:hypothetical protein